MSKMGGRDISVLDAGVSGQIFGFKCGSVTYPICSWDMEGFIDGISSIKGRVEDAVRSELP